MNTTLAQIQKELKAPKGQFNKFGNYRYRSCEDILEAVKPIAAKHDGYVTLSDSIEEIGGRVYVKATATLHSEDGESSVAAYAREAESKKGMDDAQITGAASSYARKYALNGLFAIDDTKDADSTNTNDKSTVKNPGAELKDIISQLGWDVEKVREYAKFTLPSGQDDWTKMSDDEKHMLITSLRAQAKESR